MAFSSIEFLFYFLPLFLAAYLGCVRLLGSSAGMGPANGVFLAASLLFYAWGEPVFVLLLLGSIVVNHVLAQAIARHDRMQWRLVAFGVTANLVVLVACKYAAFLGLPFEIDLPLGISFFTFQAISFLIDVARRDGPPTKTLVDTGLFITMFPQLVAGPIVRFKSVALQLHRRRHSFQGFAYGVRRFTIGLAQKTLIANVLARPADAVFDADLAQLSMAQAWLGLACYSLQIFFDFAGYSNMAIGLGRMTGFRLPENFDFPYVARSITEFWRRWHMSLSMWFRDYLYIPLGGNRVAKWRHALNLWIVFLLCGLWHGASWAFVLWGALHGAFLVFERTPLGTAIARLPTPVRRVYTLLLVMLAWVPFRAESIGPAVQFYGVLLVPDLAEATRTPLYIGFESGHAWVLAIGVGIAMWPAWRGPVLSAMDRIRQHAPGRLVADGVDVLGLAALWIACAAFLAGDTHNPFIYFRF
jgi:alginate O-acetyltransferase complex protein AlgI